ncbi:cytidylyltransferase domain-containing protein [Novipirellula sp. SH528]|uniref:acylneuraminate cytidylyltransferase family protein n=1 Tax=Novipirellula sp. SH528 TaxID=3454466 RepID=UPI003FA1785F
MRVLGIITARGGSKGVPRKNLAKIGGRSLLSYTAAAARESRHLTRTVISTDDNEIAEEAVRCGVELPFMRPAELARDETPTMPVLQHAVQKLEEAGEQYDAICILQPTHPFRSADDIDRCVELLASSEADAVMTIAAVPAEFNPHWTYFMDDNGGLRIATGESTPIARRQELPPAYHREGSVYVTRRDVLMLQNSLYGKHVLGVPVDPEFRVNIDTMDDFRRAEALMAKIQEAT